MPQSIGDRSLDNGVVGYKCRRTGEKLAVAIKEIIAMFKAKLGRELPPCHHKKARLMARFLFLLS